MYKEEVIREIDQIIHAWNCRKITADKCIKLIREKVGLEEISEEYQFDFLWDKSK